MNYPSIRIEGAILSPDILGRLEDLPGQKPADFGLDSSIKVKDEIVRAWADAQDYWRIFQRKLESLRPESPATSETRQLWMVPLLALLGYQVEFQVRGAELNGKIYAISHRAVNRAQAPVQIVGYREPAGLDRKPENATLRMSAHAIVQEFINLNEQLYGLVTNGRVLRLLRNSSRLIKLSYLEFDLDRIFTDGLYSDFAVLYRLLHATRLPFSDETSKESWIERYHQDSIESGARIRDGLSSAVEAAIRAFGTGFLNHPANNALHDAAVNGGLRPSEYYNNLLRLIYRLLFLMVIEERDLVFPTAVEKKQRDIYRLYYSVQRLRELSEHRHLADHRQHDMWLALLSTFRLFEADGPGEKLGISPLAGDLFGNQAIPLLAPCTLGNDVLLGCLRALNVYEHPENHQLIRVNYAALNVEEFGSVYEGLLEYEPVFINHGNTVEFSFAQGDERARTGSHYTPDDLVQPLIKHSLDYLIAERLKAPKPEAALLDLRVADISCGSGHILLAAARRIAHELAVVRTGEEQPSPPAFRAALRDVIRNCIYGVDLNPQAVELCKVALWLEAHNPGQPLNFLDHHIKRGNAIVGFVRQEELDKGVPDEAFAAMPGDEKEVGALWRKTNKQDRRDIRQRRLAPAIKQRLEGTLKRWNELSSLPERTPAEIETKKEKFLAFIDGPDASQLAQIAAIPIAQFYIPKTTENDPLLISDATFRRYWSDGLTPQGIATAKAWGVAIEKRFFHWFLEFPDIVARGGFDCILGNPPYLGNRALSGTFGDSFLNWVKHEYAPAGSVDLVTYFLRRIFDLIRPNGFLALISTNTIAQGGAREGGLDVIEKLGGSIHFATRSQRWPGRAAVSVSLLAIHRGQWKYPYVLDGQHVDRISSYLDSADSAAEPFPLEANADKSFQGSIILGMGFILSLNAAEQLASSNPKMNDVVFNYLNGDDLNSNPTQRASRSVINFFDWSEDKCRTEYPEPFAIVEAKVKPERTRRDAAGEFVLRKPLPQKWWIYADKRPKLYKTIATFDRVLVTPRVSKYVSFAFVKRRQVFMDTVVVIAHQSISAFAVLQSNLHTYWAWRFSSTMGSSTIRYSPRECFLSFPFPANGALESSLERIGQSYHERRKSLMQSLWVGLTDIYNLFHARELSPAMVAKVSKKSAEEAARGYEGLLELRRLHVQLDLAIRDAYGWQDLPLNHDFYEVDILPDNDRVRYTISPAARREVLRRLLKLNHERAAEEEAKIKAAPKAAREKRGEKALSSDAQPGLSFDES
jgi:methylase of polypeptide subunit release factors